MNSLEEYSKDWKQIKGRQTSADKHFFNINNQKIMNSIIKFEKQERKENKWGAILGLSGLILGCLLGIAKPIYQTSLNLNGIILSGVILMSLGVLYMIINTRIERINLENLDENSKAYLMTVKEKLKNSGRRKAWNRLVNVTVILSGMTCVFWGVFTQMSNGENLFNNGIWMPVFFGVLGWVTWRIRYNRKEKTKIQPLIKEIDSMLQEVE